MTKPAKLPSWATDSTFNDPGTDWDGTATRLEPSSGEKAAGASPNTGLSAQKFNYLVGNVSDWIDFLYSEIWKSQLVQDHFTGSALDTAIWATIVGTPTLPDDSANGGSGTAKFDGASNQAIQTANFATGTGDFRFIARARVTSMHASTGINLGFGGTFFYGDGGVSTTNWQVKIDGVSTAPNGAASAFSSSYKTFEITRVSNVVTLAVDGVTLHSQAYTTNNTGTAISISSSGGTGVLWVDAVAMWMF